jgi:hypothetical protein
MKPQKLFIMALLICSLLIASCGNITTSTTTQTIDRTVIGTVQTIDSYSNYSILHFDNNVNIEVTNASLQNWWVGHMFGQVATYQLQGVGMIFDDGYHEFNLVGFQIGQAIIGGSK